jgi:hypothetical protein
LPKFRLIEAVSQPIPIYPIKARSSLKPDHRAGSLWEPAVDWAAAQLLEEITSSLLQIGNW